MHTRPNSFEIVINTHHLSLIMGKKTPKKRIFSAAPAAVLITITIILTIVILTACTRPANSEKIIKKSVPQGDEIRDPRSASEACDPITSEVQNSNPGFGCRLIDSERVDGITSEKCVDGGSVAGCYVCTFGCVINPTDRESCESADGKWEKIGLAQEERCNLPTSDAGKECSDSDECEGSCITKLSRDDLITANESEAANPQGECTAWRITVGCQNLVIDGKAQGVLCID